MANLHMSYFSNFSTYFVSVRKEIREKNEEIENLKAVEILRKVCISLKKNGRQNDGL